MVEQTNRSLEPTGAQVPLPADQLSLIAKAFMEGAAAHKRSMETTTPSASSKLSKTQLTQLMEWCGLGPGEQYKLPPIWAKLQGANDKEDAQAVLTKHFERLSAGLEEPLNI